MIARHWRGWTSVQDATAYENLLKDKVLPELRKTEGYRGGYVFRLDGSEEVEFVVVNGEITFEHGECTGAAPGAMVASHWGSKKPVAVAAE